MYKVYIVDDDELILDEIINTVPWLDNGYEVIGSAAHPVKAMDEIVILCPDVVVCDLKMPGMDGNEMISRLREDFQDMEFIMLSAYGTFTDSRAFFLLNGFDYILKPLQQPEIQMVLERLAAKLSKKKGETQLVEKDGVNLSFTELVRYITGHFDKRHTLEELGQQFNLNPNYICNLFARHYNSTLTRFLTGIRMAEAARLITSSGKPFKEIAISCGYTDYYYFCKVFKETYEMSPTQYRKSGAGSTVR